MEAGLRSSVDGSASSWRPRISAVAATNWLSDYDADAAARKGIMITEETVEGQKVIVAYMKDDFTPAGKEDPTLVKVIFEDGRVVFGVPQEKQDAPPLL